MKNIFYTFLLISPLLFVSSCEEDVVHGCQDSQACNYNSQATIDNNSCIYEIDECGECGGDGPELGYDCDGNFAANIGMKAEGGIVFYIDETGEHGLVAALEDLEGIEEWGCYGTSVSAYGTAIGTGYQNTLDIVSGCSETPIAASEALAYESEGYSDWYLPSKDELLEMYNTIGNGGPEGNIGGFINFWYWSSSESGSDYASGVYFFGGGSTLYYGKDGAARVRVIRAF